MKIKELGLIHFGKFNNKIIKLNSGINYIRGNNESGKSTTFSFIMGILYGFSKDSKSRRIYDFNKEKYKPWNSESYTGYMEIENNYTYRIERDFNSDNLKFLNLNNGQDLSSNEKLQEFSRIKQPGSYLFNVNRDFFENTVFIGQLSTKISENSYETLRNKLLNVHSSNDENINVNKACEILNDSLKSLGKESRKSSDIGTLKLEIENLISEILKLEDETKDYLDYVNKLKNIKDEINKLNSEKKLSIKIKEQKIYNEVCEKEDEIKRLKRNINTYYEKDYEDVINIESEIQHLEEDINELNIRLINISAFKETLNKEDIERDYNSVLLYNLNKKESEKEEFEHIKNDIKNNKFLRKKLFSMILSSVIVIIIIFIISIFTKKYFINAISLISVIFIYLKFMKYKVNKEVGNVLEKKKYEINLKTDNIKDIDKIRNIILKYNTDMDNMEDCLKELLEKANYEYYKKESIAKEKKSLENLINDKINKKKELVNKLKNLSSKYNILDIEMLKEYLLKNSGSSNNDKIKNLQNIISILLNGSNKENLNHNINVNEYNIKDVDYLLRSKELKEVSLKENIRILEEKIKKQEILKEKLGNKEMELEKLSKKRDNTEIALASLEKLLNNNRDDILPSVIEKMNYIISKITNRKYSDLLLDNDFNIKIKDEKNNSYVDISSLSSGTVDQIYFSFRIAMAELLLKDAPLILDDHFLQYDDLRMENTLEYLNRLKDSRQIIIFSATERELNCLDKSNIKYNLINL